MSHSRKHSLEDNLLPNEVKESKQPETHIIFYQQPMDGALTQPLDESPDQIYDRCIVDTLQQAEENQALTALDFTRMEVQDIKTAERVMAFLATHPLVTVKFDYCPLPRFAFQIHQFHILAMHTVLETLSLSGALSFSLPMIESLCQLLQSNTALRHLDLSNQDFNAHPLEVEAVSEDMQQMKISEEPHYSEETQACSAIAQLLLVNNTLQSLKLGNLHLDDQAVSALALGFKAQDEKKPGEFKTNSSLTALTLKYNRIGAAGLAALTDALLFTRNQSLQTLDLQYNQLETATQSICQLIAVDVDAEKKASPRTGITDLNLEGCDITQEGFTAIAAHLTHSRVQRIVLADNEIRHIAPLVPLLWQNQSLTEVDMGYVGKTTANLISLFEILPQNKTLRTLKLTTDSKCIDATVDTAIAAAMKVNKTLLQAPLRCDSLQNALRRNAKIDLRVQRNFQRLAILFAFIRANQVSPLRFSILALIPGIAKLVSTPLRTPEILHQQRKTLWTESTTEEPDVRLLPSSCVKSNFQR